METMCLLVTTQRDYLFSVAECLLSPFAMVLMVLSNSAAVRRTTPTVIPQASQTQAMACVQLSNLLQEMDRS